METQYHIFELSEWDKVEVTGESIAVFSSEEEAIAHIKDNLTKGSYKILKFYFKN